MRIVMNFGAAGLAAAIMLAGTACTPSSSPGSVSLSASPSVTGPATPTPTPTVLTPDEQDLESARAAVAKFWQVLDRVGADPDVSLNALNRVARDPALEQAQKDMTAWRVAGYRLTGSTVVEESTARLTKPNAWTVTSCVDTSKSDVVDREGKSVMGPPYRIKHRSTVIRDSGTFYVTADKALETC